jgi:uncharacterized Zn finger protein
MPRYGAYEDDERAGRAADLTRKLEKLRKQGEYLDPSVCPRRQGLPAESFWGIAWCENLESYSDYSDRMPRGRTYLRQGHVLGLRIEPGEVFAYVTGDDLYEVLVKIDPLPPPAWEKLKAACGSSIGSLLDLLAGRLGPELLEVITSRETGLFPNPRQIHLTCTCPDYANMCQHVAAVLYGAGVKLDQEPELFFKLRQVDHRELVQQAATHAENLASDIPADEAARQALANIDLSELFGIEITEPELAFSMPPLKLGGSGELATREQNAF